MPKNYTVKQVAEILGFSTNSIYTFLKEKRIAGVRIGKGRFRIPDEELRRILHLSKKPIEEVAIPAPAPAGDAAVVPAQEQNMGAHLTHWKIQLPNIFDWFVGLSAVIAGISLFLFNSLFADPSTAFLTSGLGAMRIILITGGLGIVFSSIKEGSGRWHRLFHIVLSLIGLVNAFILYRLGDFDGALFYGSLGLVTGVTGIWHVGGIFGFGIYVSVIAILAPVLILFGAGNSHVQILASVLSLSPGRLGVIAASTGIGFLAIFWSGYVGQRWLFWLASLLGSAAFFALAVGYGELQLWSRAFFLVVVGFFSGMLPSWWWLSEAVSRRGRLVVHGLFGAIGVVVIAGIVVIGLLQRSFWFQHEAEFSNKMTIAENILASAVDAVKSSAVVAAGNPDFVSAVTKKDTAELTRLSKIVYESNPDIRRIVYLDRFGDGIALYPYGTFDQPNLSFRDYFIQARDTGALYTSNVFQALGDQSGRYVIAVAVPIKEAGAFAGVMTTSIDVDRLGVELGQIAVEERGEYFVVTDQTGKVLIHPDRTKVGTDISSDEIVSRALAGQNGVTGKQLADGTSGMVAYGKVPGLDWTVSLNAPAQKIFQLNSSTIATIMVAVIVFMLVTMWLFIFIRDRGGVLMLGGP